MMGQHARSESLFYESQLKSMALSEPAISGYYSTAEMIACRGANGPAVAATGV